MAAYRSTRPVEYAHASLVQQVDQAEQVRETAVVNLRDEGSRFVTRCMRYVDDGRSVTRTTFLLKSVDSSR